MHCCATFELCPICFPVSCYEGPVIIYGQGKVRFKQLLTGNFLRPTNCAVEKLMTNSALGENLLTNKFDVKYGIN